MADRQSRTFFGIFINGNQATDTLKNLREESRKLKNEIANLIPGTEQYRRKMEELQGVEKHIRRHRDEVNGLGSVWSKIKTEVKAFGVVALAALGAGAIVGGISNMIRRLATLSDAWGDVRKSTGFTENQIESLNKKLGALNTRTPRSELIKLAAEAGRQGKKTVDEVSTFVKEYDMLQTALGEDVAGVIPAIGKLTAIYKTSATQIGSALNEIEDASIATANYQVDFLNRTSGLATTLKDISIPIMVGYGATLETLGQTAEKSGTAVNQILFDFIKNTADFERVAGMVPGTLKRIIGEKGTNEGFLAWLDALKATNPEAEQMLHALEEIGVNGDRGANVLLSLAGNTALVREQQAVANKAFEDGTSIMDEFNRRQETFGATVDRLTKKLNSWFLNNPVTKGVQSLITGFTNLVDPIKKVSENLEDERFRLNQLVFTYTNVNASQQARKQALEELKTAYPDFIKLVDIDTASNEELFAALEKVNGEYAARIVIQRKGEDLADQGEEQADALQRQLDIETELSIAMTEIHDKYKIRQGDNESNADFLDRYHNAILQYGKDNNYGSAIDNIASVNRKKLSDILMRLTGAQNAYNKETKAYNLLLEEKNNLEHKLLGTADDTNAAATIGIEYTKLSADELMKLADAGDFMAQSILDNMHAVAEEEKKTAEKIAADRKRLDDQLKEIEREHNQWLMSEQEKERDNVAKKYEDLRILAHGNSGKLIELNALEKEELDRIDKKYADQAVENWKKAWTVIGETIGRVVTENKIALDAYIAESVASNDDYLQAVMTTQEWEEYLIDQHFINLIAKATKNHEDTAVLYAAWDAARAANLTDDADTEIAIEQRKWEAKKSLAQASISIIDSIVSLANAKSTKAGKAAALVQIAIDKASAIGDIVRMAAEAAANFGPLGPLVFGGYFASGLALVLGGIREAKDVLQADQAAEGGYMQDVIGNQSGKKYKARTVPNWNGGLAKNSLLVGEEGAEYTVPRWMLNDPFVLDTVNILESIRTHRQMASGGFVDRSVATIPDVAKAPSSHSYDSKAAAGNKDDVVSKEMLELLRTLNKNGVVFKPNDRFIDYVGDRTNFLGVAWRNFEK